MFARFSLHYKLKYTLMNQNKRSKPVQILVQIIIVQSCRYFDQYTFLPLLSVRVPETFHFVFMVMLAGAIEREYYGVKTCMKSHLYSQFQGRLLLILYTKLQLPTLPACQRQSYVRCYMPFLFPICTLLFILAIYKLNGDLERYQL